MGFNSVESTTTCDTYRKGDLEVNVYEEELTTNWYIGEEKQTRTSQRRSWTWKNKRFSSGSHTWEEIDKLKQITDENKHQPIDDKSVQKE